MYKYCCPWPSKLSLVCLGLCQWWNDWVLWYIRLLHSEAMDYGSLGDDASKSELCNEKIFLSWSVSYFYMQMRTISKHPQQRKVDATLVNKKYTIQRIPKWRENKIKELNGRYTQPVAFGQPQPVNEIWKGKAIKPKRHPSTMKREI